MNYFNTLNDTVNITAEGDGFLQDIWAYEYINYTCEAGHYFNDSSKGNKFSVICDWDESLDTILDPLPACVTEVPCPDPVDFGLPVQVNNTAPGTYKTNDVVTYSCQDPTQELWVDGAPYSQATFHSTCDWMNWTLGGSNIQCPSKI